MNYPRLPPLDDLEELPELRLLLLLLDDLVEDPLELDELLVLGV